MEMLDPDWDSTIVPVTTMEHMVVDTQPEPISVEEMDSALACVNSIRDYRWLLPTCNVCMFMPTTVILNCGHSLCQDCSEKVTRCPTCWNEIWNRITVLGLECQDKVDADMMRCKATDTSDDEYLASSVLPSV